jgi:hypothetical protein
MAQRIFLHIGTPKSGTTYLQTLLWKNKTALAKQGLLLPLDSVRDHFFLSNLGREAEDDVANMPPRALGAWDRMMEQVGSTSGDVLISHELFAMTLPDRATWILDQLRSVGTEVHPIITARDLARQVPAEWQQSVKHGRTHTLREFYGLIRDQDPSVLFWRAQELPTQVRMWSQGLSPENVHLVTIPPLGGPDDALWKRYASVIGIDPEAVELPTALPNVSLGLVEVEMLRRVNVHAPMGATKPLQQRMVREILGDGILAQRPNASKFAPPPEEHPWVVEFGTAMVDELRSMAFDVVGDLDDLLPPAAPIAGRVPDDVDDSEVAEVAVETISAVLYRSHEREREQAQKEIDRLKDTVKSKAGETRELEKNLKAAWQAYENERDLPLWRHTARRARSLAKRVTGRSQG